jgi:hypothetical protein
MDWAGERGAGRVTCVSVSGNSATVGIVTPQSLPLR